MLRNFRSVLSSSAGIQYMGLPGISASCLEAVKRLIQFAEPIERALILTCDQCHAFLFTVQTEELVAVKTGFASGYPGEGPRTFAEALCVLRSRWKSTSARFQRKLLERLDASALTVKDLDSIDAAPLVRPLRWHDYAYEMRHFIGNENSIFASFREVMPWAIIDGRIVDLAQTFFGNEDTCIYTGFRRLEDIVRKRSGLEEHGTKLMQQAFLGKNPPLMWKVRDPGEQTGRAQLLVGAFMAYRNPRAHSEPGGNGEGQLTEFLMLNQLYVLERETLRHTPRRRLTVGEPPP